MYHLNINTLNRRENKSVTGCSGFFNITNTVSDSGLFKTADIVSGFPNTSCSGNLDIVYGYFYDSGFSNAGCSDCLDFLNTRKTATGCSASDTTGYSDDILHYNVSCAVKDFSKKIVLWHSRLGHPSNLVFKHIDCLQKNIHDDGFCEVCQLA